MGIIFPGRLGIIFPGLVAIRGRKISGNRWISVKRDFMGILHKMKKTFMTFPLDCCIGKREREGVWRPGIDFTSAYSPPL